MAYFGRAPKKPQQLGRVVGGRTRPGLVVPGATGRPARRGESAGRVERSPRGGRALREGRATRAGRKPR